MEAARHLVAAAAELAAGVEHGVDDLEGVLAGRVASDRHAATVVAHGDRAVRADRHVDRGRVAGHRLVDRVVDDLPHEVVQAAAVRRADVHAGATPHGLEALEDLDARGGVLAADLRPSGRSCVRPCRPSSSLPRSRAASDQALVEPPELLVAVVLDHDPAAPATPGQANLRAEGLAQLVLDALEIGVDGARAAGR